MTQSTRSRVVVTAAVGVATTVGLLAGVGDAIAAGGKKKPAQVIQMQTPLGLQGTRGAGTNVVVPFSLLDKSRRKSDVQAEYGWDMNNDGVIADGSEPGLPSEYRQATEDRRDPRNTRKNKKPQLFTTAGDIGASQAFVWNSVADVSTGHFPTIQFLYTQDGRPVPDPDNPGSILFDETLAGMKVRVRAKAKKGGATSPWIYSSAFALNNNTPPSMTIDGVIPNATSTPTASDEVVEINWTAFDDDSEDLNGNGVLDLLDLEDKNGNGVLDPEYVAVAFDYFRLPEGVDPASYSKSDLESLIWLPCTRAVGFGTEPSAPAGLRIDGYPSAPAPVGRAHVWAWDSVTDVGTVNASFMLRARPFDEKREPGEVVYFQNGFRLDNWKIFNSPGAASALPGGRVGTASVNLTPGLSRSDPQYNTGRQAFLITGGAAQDGGAGTNYLAVQIVNTDTSETTTSSAAPFTNLIDARSFHTATVLGDGRVLIAGGFGAGGAPLQTTEIYDPVTKTSEQGPDLLVARARHSAVRLTSGDVAFFGGVGAGGAVLRSSELHQFTPTAIDAGGPVASEPNIALPDMAVAQHTLHAQLLPDQRVLVAGGISSAGTAVQTAEVLNPLNDNDISDPTTKDPIFEPVGSMNEARMFASATVLHDGNIVFAGGAASPSKASLEVFNWVTQKFERIVDANGNNMTMDFGRSQHAAALLGDGTVVLAGGTSDPAVGDVLGDADVFQLGMRDSASATWSGTFLPVNGDMRFPRRRAESVTINNGRVFFVGGQTATGGALSDLETYTPENGTNFRPSARTDLASKQQSWAFGAPILYRVIDPEQDNVRVVVQWSDNAGVTWHAAAPQPLTIGGNVSEPTANRTTGLVDDQLLKIDPKSFPESDHDYIWGMTRDIPRPPEGGSSGPYIFRTTPYGAVQGPASASVPVTVLYNTKVIPTIVALEDDATGAVNPNQGGDIGIWVHLRDIDGPGEGPRAGDVARGIFEFAVDENNNGIIDDGLEFWTQMSQSSAGVDPAMRGVAGANVLEPLQTWSESPENSDPETRPADKGWVFFDWDSLYDLGAPQSSWGNIWVRIRPFDNLSAEDVEGGVADEGFTAVLRNAADAPEDIRVIRDPDALWLDRLTAVGGDNLMVRTNEPVELHFNGLVDAASVSADTIQISRNGAQILGVFTTAIDTASHTSVVTFYPRPNNTILDALEYTENSNPTVLFPARSYEVSIPGYMRGDDLSALPGNMQDTLRPVITGFPAPVNQTYLLTQNVPTTTGFSTTQGNYNDGSVPDPQTFEPNLGIELDKNGTFSVSYDAALDLDTVKSPNVTVNIDNGGGPSASTAGRSVVAGRWSVTNSQNPDGTTTSVMQFTPLLQLPPGKSLVIESNGGLHGTSGLSAAAVDYGYDTAAYGTTLTSATETFTNTEFEDNSGTDLADWGDDPCSPGSLTGLQDGSTQPTGGDDLVVGTASGTIGSSDDERIVTISAQESDYNNITVHKNGRLLIRVTGGAATIRATGDIRILGTVDFSGEDGWTGAFGNSNTSSSYLYASRGVGTRLGGTAYNGGGDGGDSESSSALVRVPGDDGAGPQPGEGGNIAAAGSTSSYVYGAGGGAGGGHGQAGLPGGRDVAPFTSSRYGAKSIPGGVNGDPDMTSGPSVGSGGGGGGSNRYSSVYYHQGGAGGAGAGAVTFLCNGVFELAPSGAIEGRGGRGGASAHYAGSGGGGAGGGLLIKSGGNCTLDGVVDLRGGSGGPKGFGSWSDYYSVSNAFNNGTSRYGGDGGPGRLRVEAPNFLHHDEVRVIGQLMINQVTTLPTTGVSQSVVPQGWSRNDAGEDFGSVQLTGSSVRYSQLVVPRGHTVELSGNAATTIYVDGLVDIQGTVRMNGAEPSKGFKFAGATNGMGGTAPEFDGGGGTPATQYVGGDGSFGGGDGGAGHTNGGSATASNQYLRRGADGTGPAPGRNFSLSTTGYAWSGSRYIQFTGDLSGGGGTNSTDGDNGWAPYAASGKYNYQGAVDDTNGDGVDPDTVYTDTKDTGSRLIRLDPSSIEVTNLSSFVGSGGGGGNLGGYTYTSSNWHYFGMTGSGGGGAGALGIVGAGTVNVSGTIEAKGGHGNAPGAGAQFVSTWNWTTSTQAILGYAQSGGGGGSGGTVYIVGDDVNIAPVTVGEGSLANGATIDTQGGVGGGWRQFRVSGQSNKYPSYNTMGAFGGHGGFGRAVVRYRTSLNGGRQLFNRWGMEQSVPDTSTNRYTVLAGTATAACRGFPGGGNFQSKWYDLDSFTPVVNGIDAAQQSDVTYSLQGEGAQSHPHNTGAAGTGEPDASQTSGFQTPGPGMLDGWRWLRFKGTLERATTDPTDPAPILDDITWDYETDQVDPD